MNERKEALMRIVVGFVSGIIIGLWAALVRLLVFVHFIIVLVSGERNKDVAEFCEMFNTQLYTFARYMTFVENKRPFPFRNLTKNFSKFK